MPGGGGALAAVLFALPGWAALEYFILPLAQPLVTEKGFTPEWYALSFAVYGAVLGVLLALRPGGEGPARSSGAPAQAAPTGSTRRSDIEGWREQMRRLRGET